MVVLNRDALAAYAILMTASLAWAQEPLRESPITPGFWTWPREKTASVEAVGDACREKFAIQFPDGRYLGLRLRGTDKQVLPAPTVDEVGFCSFDRTSQIERCELHVYNGDGTSKSGAIESKFSIDADADRTIKMTVMPKIVDGSSVNAASFDVFPTKCPDDVVWNTLHGGQDPKQAR